MVLASIALTLSADPKFPIPLNYLKVVRNRHLPDSRVSLQRNPQDSFKAVK